MQNGGVDPLQFSEVEGVWTPPAWDFQRWGPTFVKSHQGPAWGSFLTIFSVALFRSPNYNNNAYTREPSIKMLQSSSNWSTDYIYVLLEHTSLMWTCHHCRWRAVKLGLWSAFRTFEQGGRSKSSFSSHTCFDPKPRTHPQHDDIAMCVVRGDWMEWSFGWDQKNQGPMSR
jgi:hypothetical protein